MSETVQLKAADGHLQDAYVARPSGEPIAGLVVVQEIFGVNAHIRSVADGYARDGFLAVAPALFDRVEKHVQLGYEGDDAQRAMALMKQVDRVKALYDVEAAIDYAREQTGKKTGVIGFCWGGTLAWLSATRLDPQAAVGYYAGGIGGFAAETPHAPVMLHFGEQDTHIPASEVAKVQQAHPQVEIHWYDAGHGFNANPRASYDAKSAALARSRSLAFLKSHLAG